LRRAGLQGVTGRPKLRRGLRPEATAADRVQRQFARAGTDRLWVTDIDTEHPTREGKLSCAVVLDACSRRVVGWSIDATPTAALVTNALGMAIESRRPAAGTLIHSDQGMQFTSWAFSQRAKASGLVPSMGGVGACFDNAVVESFWSRMQVELLDRQRWRTRWSWPMRSLSTWSSSTTASAAQLTGDAQPDRVREPSAHHRRMRQSSSPTPHNQGHA
jgi:putative transposase